MKLKLVHALALSLCLFCILASVSFPPPSAAQTRPVIIATGFEFNTFADPTNVADFNGAGPAGAFAGPTAIAFDARGRLFVGTFPGKILIMLDNDDDGRADQIKTFATGIPQPLGLTFRSNGDLYITSNQSPQNGGAGRILRLRDTNGDDVADEQTIILDGLPSLGDHQTNRLRFGPDGLLYFGQGSATDNGTPKDGRPAEGPLNGTMLRINVDAPNPTPEVFATGLRNPFGMAFHPVNGELFSTDGGSGEICQFANCGEDLSPLEEINWIVQGGNYGFPQCEGTPDGRPGCAGVRLPVQQFGQHLTPTSLAFYTGPQAGEQTNHLLVTLYKRYRGQGGDLRRLKLEGSKETGFFVSDNQQIADFGIIDPGDGPLDTAIHPISGDIYVVRFDPVQHINTFEHHHFIYRIHRTGSDALPFIGNLQPSSVKAGSSAITLTLNARHLQAGATLFADGVALPTRQGASQFDVIADLPANLLASVRTINLHVQNPDGAPSNALSFRVTNSDEPPPPPPPGKTPEITSFFTYKKQRQKVVTLLAGMNGKKFYLVVAGKDFAAGAQLLVNGTTLEIIGASETELVGRLTKPLLASPGNLTVQARNPDGKVSNTVTVPVAAQ